LYEIDRALAVFEAERDLQIIVGNRQHPNSQIIRHQSWMREAWVRLLICAGAAGWLESRFGIRMWLQGISAGRSRAIFERQRTDGLFFDVEVLLWLRLWVLA